MSDEREIVVMGSNRCGMSLLSDAVRAFFDFTDAALEAAKVSAMYAAFYARDRSPWRKRMGRRK